MKNLKKLLALMLSLAMMVTTFTLPAFAADDATEETTETTEAAVVETTNAEICEALEVLKGEGHGLTEEYLAKETPRWNVALMTVRLRGLEKEAMAYDGEDTFADAEQIIWVAGRPFLGYLKTHPELGWLGRGTDNLFDPLSMMTIQEYYKVMLEVLGYAQGTDFEWAEVMDKADEVGIAVAGDAEKLTNSLIADVTVAALKAETKDGEVLAEKLVELGTIDEEVAAKYELVKLAADAVAVDSAVALNSKVIEVELDEAIEETNAAQFVVTDEDDEIFEVESAELAPWDADKKTVLVTLAEDLKAGDLYTLKSGDASTHFGGIKEDEDRPKVTSSKTTDYNEIELVFSEPINLSTLNVEITKRDRDKKVIEVLDMVYDGSTKIILTTEEQGKKMNDIKVTDATDYAGNVMDDQKVSSVGEEKPDDPIEVKKAYANDYNEVAIHFSQRVGDVDPSMFSLYNRGKKVNNEILDAKVATGDDYYRDDKIKDLDDNAQEFVILQVEDMEKDTYVLEVKDLKSQYDTNLDSKKDTTTFIGMEKPSDPFKLKEAKAISNTEVSLEFDNKIDETVGEDITNYDITYRNKDKDVLEVKEATVDGKKVTLTVESMEKGTCIIEINNDLLDIYGNKLDSDDDKDSFVAKEVADKIEKVKSIKRDGDTKIIVAFDQDLGDNAEDVGFYNINREIGYPISASLDSDNPDQVTLTIPKTVSGKVYELTVNKGLENVDGIVSTDKLEKTFAGKGTSTKKATLSWATIVDNQTVMLVFDRSVKDSTVDGVLWDSDNNTLTKNAFILKDDDAEYDLAVGMPVDGNNNIDLSKTAHADPYIAYAYQQADEDEVLIIRSSQKIFDNKYIEKDDDLKIVVNEKLVVHEDDKNETEIYATDEEPKVPKLESAMAYSKNVVEVEFSEPVSIPNTFIVNADKGINGADKDEFCIRKSEDDNYSYIKQMTKVNDYTYRLKLVKDLDEDEIDDDMAYIFINNGFITDASTTVDVVNEDDDEDDILFEFAAEYDNLDKIDTVYAAMSDNRTLVVQYNDTTMDESDVKDITNYSVVTDEENGATAAGVEFIPGYTTYNDSTNEVFLYLTAPIDADKEYYLAIKSTVKDELHSNSIDGKYDDVHFGSGTADALIVPFSTEDDDPAAPEFANAVVSDDRYTLTISFDQDVCIKDLYDFDDDAFEGVTRSILLDTLNIKAQLGDATSASKVGVTDIVSINPVNFSKIEVKFNKQLKVGSQGEVNTDDTTRKFVTRAKSDSDDTESIPFSVKDSLFSTAAEKAVIAVEEVAKGLVLDGALGDFNDLAETTDEYIAAKAEINKLDAETSSKKDLQDRMTQIDKIRGAIEEVEDLNDATTDVLNDENIGTAKKALGDAETALGFVDAGEIKNKLQEYVTVAEDKINIYEAGVAVDALEAVMEADYDFTVEANQTTYNENLEAAETAVEKVPEDTDEVATKKDLEDRIKIVKDAKKVIDDAIEAAKEKIDAAKEAVTELETAIKADLTVEANRIVYNGKLIAANDKVREITEESLEVTKNALTERISNVTDIKKVIDDAVTKSDELNDAVEDYNTAKGADPIVADDVIATKAIVTTKISELNDEITKVTDAVADTDFDVTSTVNALNKFRARNSKLK
jgi:hypothetical protein